MRCPRDRWVLAVLLSAPCVPAGSEPLNADFSATVDDAGGHRIDADFSRAPTERLSQPGRWAIDRRGRDRATGAALSYDRFDDGSNYQSATLGGRLSFTAGYLEVSLLGRRRFPAWWTAIGAGTSASRGCHSVFRAEQGRTGREVSSNIAPTRWTPFSPCCPTRRSGSHF